ncbi:MAG: bifunctional molybdenum cofactor biosynthesis protein MoaC/MoaB [Verrucomicrobia bacterium]|nr:bifunctional molybdenum cofactor biosynthesis protein MoaC/MoaB [Verrucomicrobiota bacterium]
MRDISTKDFTLRTARARAVLHAAPATLALVREGRVPKGDPLPVAKVAAIQAAKHTSDLIPYCHPIPIEHVAVDFTLAADRIEVVVQVKAIYRTGVEMEALTAASAAALTLYDMLKMLDESMAIRSVELLEKTGGKSNFAPALRQSFRAAVVVMSDSRSQGRKADESGAILRAGLEAQQAAVESFAIVPDEREAIRAAVLAATDQRRVDLLLLTGGTGLGPRDVTPEAIGDLLDRRLPGVEDQFRAHSRERNPYAMMSRMLAGQRGRTLVIALPGSPGACRDALDAYFPYLKHAFLMREGAGHDPA